MSSAAFTAKECNSFLPTVSNLSHAMSAFFSSLCLQLSHNWHKHSFIPSSVPLPFLQLLTNSMASVHPFSFYAARERLPSRISFNLDCSSSNFILSMLCFILSDSNFCLCPLLSASSLAQTVSPTAPSAAQRFDQPSAPPLSLTKA